MLHALVLAVYLASPPIPVSTPPAIAAKSPAIVLGFVGGYVKRDNAVHIEVQLGTRLRKAYGTSAVVEIFENHNGEKALETLLTILDVNRDGILSGEEKKNARIVLYGHSWGASQAITLARWLEKGGIPVLLTIQVDSVSKGGENDGIIPANVAQAVNFYQSDGLLHGESEIRAADPDHTKILGNFRFSYDASPYNCTEYPWYARVFMKAHTQIECDSRVWDQVEALIRSQLPLSVSTAAPGN